MREEVSVCIAKHARLEAVAKLWQKKSDQFKTFKMLFVSKANVADTFLSPFYRSAIHICGTNGSIEIVYLSKSAEFYQQNCLKTFNKVRIKKKARGWA